MEENNTKKVLLIGNGIARCFNSSSWFEIIEDIAKEHKVDYKEIVKLYPPSQIVVASNNDLENVAKDIADKLIDKVDNKICNNNFCNSNCLLNTILSKRFDSILTTNYSNELERCFMHKKNLSKVSKKYTMPNLPEKKKRFQLYRYSSLGNNKVWHIHGDDKVPKSIIADTSYYCKLVAQIEEVLSKLLRRTYAKNFEYKTWVDYFVLGEVHILGFGLDFSEIDIWYLLDYKNRKYGSCKTIYHCPNGKIGLSTEKELLLKTYGVYIEDSIVLNNDNYLKYYLDVLSSIG